MSGNNVMSKVQKHKEQLYTEDVMLFLNFQQPPTPLCHPRTKLL